MFRDTLWKKNYNSMLQSCTIWMFHVEHNRQIKSATIFNSEKLLILQNVSRETFLIFSLETIGK